MQSPFPGMNPYLESSLWQGVHTKLLSAIADALNERLNDEYRADVEQTAYITQVDPNGTAIPVQVGRSDVVVLSDVQPQDETNAASLITVIEVPVQVELPQIEEVTERWLEIRSVVDGTVVTTIEVLSPANKLDRFKRERYENKRNQVLTTRSHLVEIDLIRAGQPFPALHQPRSHYRILVSRSEQRPGAALYPFNLPQPIPVIPVPLMGPDEAVPLDLQKLIDGIYERGKYHLAIDYGNAPPAPALSDEEQQWLEQIVQQIRQS